MGILQSILGNLPEVASPTQKKLSFKEKLKWTSIILILFFGMGLVPLFGLGQNALAQFEYLSIILGASFGSVISLGIGPMVTSSIVLQLLNGSGMVKFDLTSPDGRVSSCARINRNRTLFSDGVTSYFSTVFRRHAHHVHG